MSDLAAHEIDLVRVPGVRHLDIDRTEPPAGTVTVKHQIEGTHDPLRPADGGLYGGGCLVIYPLAQYLADRLEDHLDSRADDNSGNEQTEPRLETESGSYEDHGGDDRRERDDGVEKRVLAGVFQRVGVEFPALIADEKSEGYLDRHCRTDHDERHREILGRDGMDYLLYRLHERRNAGVNYDRRDYGGADVFYSAVTQGVLSVGGSSRDLGAYDGHHRREHVAQVVHGVQDDCDGVGEESHERFEGSEEDIGDNAGDPRTDYSFFPRFRVHEIASR